MKAPEKLVQLHREIRFTCSPGVSDYKSASLTADVAVKFADFLGERYESWWEDDTWIKKSDDMIEKIRNRQAKFHTTSELFNYFLEHVYKPE